MPRFTAFSLFAAIAAAPLFLAGCSQEGAKPLEDSILSEPGSSNPKGLPRKLEEQVEEQEEVEENEEEEVTAEDEVQDTDLVESAFDSNQWNTAVGLGGGAGGAWGGRRGARRRAGVPLVASATGESYGTVIENAFKLVGAEPISTFGVDVDTASYTNVRRFLQYGQLPPAKAVRVEEMINYFDYDYPQPDGKHSFSVTMERGACPWNGDHQLVLVGLQGKNLDSDKVPPRNLVFLIDVSGSMSSPDKLPLVQRSLLRMVKGLTAKDTVAIVTYAGSERVALPPTSCAEKQKIRDCLADLGAGGSTNGAGGIQKAYDLAQKSFHREHANRVILVTDGDFNVGISDPADLKGLIAKQRESGVFLTVIGVGTGNLGDDTMSTLAKHGNGQYIYLDSEEEARRQFEKDLVGTLVTIAKDVKLQVVFDPKQVAGYRLIGYERRLMKTEDFRDDKKDSGEIGAGHAVTALYEIVPAGGEVPGSGCSDDEALDPSEGAVPASGSSLAGMIEVRLRYKAPWASSARETRHPMAARANRTANLDFASAVAAFGMVLANSSHRGTATMKSVVELAKRSSSRPDSVSAEKREEFVRLAETAGAIVDAIAAKADRANPNEGDALDWLRGKQNPDGSFGAKGECPVHDVGLTGLALLAFLGNGSTLRSGPDRGAIKAAVKWLRDRQDDAGCFRSESSKGALLDHTIAAFAMCEAFALSKYKVIKKNAASARAYTIEHADAGPEVRGWQILADVAYGHSGLGSLGSSLEKAEWRPAGAEHEMTPPTELLDRFVLRGEVRKASDPEPPIADRIVASAASFGKDTKTDTAYWYFSTLAMQALGGKYDVRWRTSLLPRMAKAQNGDGSFLAAASENRKLYDTALFALTMSARRDGRSGR